MNKEDHSTEHFLTAMTFVKKSEAALAHAEEIAESDSPIAEEICLACALICRKSMEAIESLPLENKAELKAICSWREELCKSLTISNHEDRE